MHQSTILPFILETSRIVKSGDVLIRKPPSSEKSADVDTTDKDSTVSKLSQEISSLLQTISCDSLSGRIFGEEVSTHQRACKTVLQTCAAQFGKQHVCSIIRDEASCMGVMYAREQFYVDYVDTVCGGNNKYTVSCMLLTQEDMTEYLQATQGMGQDIWEPFVMPNKLTFTIPSLCWLVIYHTRRK